jgi:hypothetical protein
MEVLMRFRSQVAHFALGAATLAMLAGCSGAGGGSVTPASPGSAVDAVAVAQGVSRACGTTHLMQAGHFWDPTVRLHPSRAVRAFVSPAFTAKTTNVLAVADEANGVVDIFNASGTQLAELTGFESPDGIASDIRGDLFVADSNNQRIVAYAAGLHGSPLYLDEPGLHPSGVDSFENGKIVAAANFGSGCMAGSVSFFIDGVLTKTISSPALASAYFCAFDAVGNLYVDGRNSDDVPVIGEIARGVHGTTFTPLTTTNTFDSAVSIQVTTSGKIAVLDQVGAIYTYNPPVSGSLGAPISTTILTSTNSVGFALTKNLRSVYASDYRHGAIDESAFPAGGSLLSSIAMAGSPIGVAVIPTEFPKR